MILNLAALRRLQLLIFEPITKSATLGTTYTRDNNLVFAAFRYEAEKFKDCLFHQIFATFDDWITSFWKASIAGNNLLIYLYVRPHLDYGDVIYHIPPKKSDFSQDTSLNNYGKTRISSIFCCTSSDWNMERNIS